MAREFKPIRNLTEISFLSVLHKKSAFFLNADFLLAYRARTQGFSDGSKSIVEIITRQALLDFSLFSWGASRKTVINCFSLAYLLPLPKNSTSFDLSNFFIHCESNGISSRVSVHIIAAGVYHQTQAVSYFAMMIYKAHALVIYKTAF